MIKTKTIVIVLMVSSIIGKKSPRRECRPGHQAKDSTQRTRRKRASPTLYRLDLSSRYFLKRSNIDISRSAKFLSKR
jgi:ribosomal protein L20A (L18A)